MCLSVCLSTSPLLNKYLSYIYIIYPHRIPRQSAAIRQRFGFQDGTRDITEVVMRTSSKSQRSYSRIPSTSAFAILHFRAAELQLLHNRSAHRKSPAVPLRTNPHCLHPRGHSATPLLPCEASPPAAVDRQSGSVFKVGLTNFSF